ncbi:biotin--[acetyl-CoA-carboxylase] ligase [Donghicola mangrovi]|uniref:biotin--[biotin carboxyl-carrier protein] ligase n=1 Tax=Donghicola mangrovi TaxID=2729614 RepID=A0A850QDC2_9RHOB|nr:biotin--[acetyl-CoA-carboxylase] ligase [Donghicola mangrovi]NVO23871.1 biotin--[acetyl-CoA-carboxylase] ligase [Donghicola mangrovi]
MSGWPVEYARRVLSRVDSTNAEAARIAPELIQPTWILALEQTAGRGRRGRVWENPKGNFAATLLLRPNEAPHLMALRSFVAALALHEAFVTVSGRPEAFALKWPNDVLLNGGKVAGILLESVGVFHGVSYLAVGIGVNLIGAPDPAVLEERAVRPVSLLSETGAHVTPEEFLDVLAGAYAAFETQFTTYGFEPIRQAWLARAAKLGEVITARTGNTERVGTFETLDEHGNLVLRTARGREAIPAADVFF